MILDYSTIMQKIVDSTGLERTDVEGKVNQKLSEMQDLITKEGAAHIIANELNVRLFDSTEKSNNFILIDIFYNKCNKYAHYTKERYIPKAKRKSNKNPIICILPKWNSDSLLPNSRAFQNAKTSIILFNPIKTPPDNAIIEIKSCTPLKKRSNGMIIT